MEKLVYGENRDKELDKFQNYKTEYFTPHSNFDRLNVVGTKTEEKIYYIFSEAHDYSRKQWNKIEDAREDMDFVILSKNKDDIPDSLSDINSKKLGKTRKDDFFTKLSALRNDEPSDRQVSMLKKMPLNYIIEQLGNVESDMYEDVPDQLDFVNRRLHEVNQEILTSYLAHKVHVPDKTVFYGDKWSNQFEDIVEELSDIEDMSEQEVKRNIKVLVAKNYEKLDYGIKEDITDRKDLYEVEENMNNKKLGDVM